ncbi:AraC family transcriptional regulator [Paenibacillus glycanilyticus]|uniref:AraC family transcriptional regulator n=1 Tax=Paenibacillus glycanilyticus TaxID=126569 RepID=A0ABQ6NUH7_9BACL|nr:AraC family transcriptional regulator [Paenibacillus glycanilyticus]GMK47887.1 AraC family transcriptional regulator [Paenibacillus glycanilyticus]
MKDYGHEFADIIYYTPNEFEKLGGLWSLRTGHNIAKANYSVGPRVIECFSFHFVLNGSVTLSSMGETVTLPKGSMFCLFPDVKHSYWITQYDSASPLKLHWLAFTGSQAEMLVRRIGVSEQKPYLRNRLTAELANQLQACMERMKNWRKDGDLQLQMMLYQLFEMLSRPIPEASEEKDWLKACLQYMQTHYAEGISVTDLAEWSGMHRSHLSSRFKQSFGMSPREYLIKLRMERAVEMLQSRTLSITDISLSLGYTDLYTFSRAFCTYTGMSPSNYRSKLLSSNKMPN